MQLLICPGYHSPDVTHAFVQSLLRMITPERLWILNLGHIQNWSFFGRESDRFQLGRGLPFWASPDTLPWQSTKNQCPQLEYPLQIIGFSAGVVAAYPFALAWQKLGGTSQMIAMDGWGMPLWGDLTIYRVSHDRWTHCTTYLPTPAESAGYFYADPAVDHLALWQSSSLIKGMGTMGTAARPMTMLEFIVAALNKPLG